MINGLDISVYQEQPLYGKLIDWKALKGDPLGMLFIWIKCAEGVGVANYPIADVIRQVQGAQSVGFEAINGYHFYYYAYSATGQAQTFFDACKAANIPGRHPMTDIEDPFTSQYLVWTDTATANAAIAFARKLNAHLKAYHEEITRLFGVHPDIYTGAWWWDRMGKLILANYPAEATWWKDYRFVLADYTGGLDYPQGITPEQTIAWQRTSQPVPPVKGIPTGHVVPGDALDIDQWMQSDQAFEDWKGGTITPPVEKIMTYKQTIPQASRGRFVWLSSDDKNIDIPGVCAGSDAEFLRMVSQATGDMTVLKDNAFGTWADRMTRPALGVVELDQNLFWNKEIDLNTFQNNKVRNLWTNETIRAILEQWHVSQIPAAEWDAKHLNIVASEGWHPLSGIVLYMASTLAKGSKIGGQWQQAIVDDVVNLLTTLMQGGYIPTVKIFVAANFDWYRTYVSDAGWTPGPRIVAGLLAGLGVTRVWGQADTGLLTETPMGTPYATLAEVWQNVPADGYAYPTGLVNGLDFHFFVWSFNRLRATSMFYPASTVTPVTCGTWCDTVEEMAETLGVTIAPPPPPPPDDNPDLAALTARVQTIEKKLADIKALL